MKIVALVSKQGTACAETALYGADDTPENRASVELDAVLDLSPDAPVPGSWTDVSDNDALWSSSPCPLDPDNFWIDDATGERVNAKTGERTAP
ncbi:MAG: hypothetical protein ACSLE8_06160 [Rhodococcus sp. (in: high G+C Gram-positive bacteria)]